MCFLAPLPRPTCGAEPDPDASQEKARSVGEACFEDNAPLVGSEQAGCGGRGEHGGFPTSAGAVFSAVLLRTQRAVALEERFEGADYPGACF